MDFERATINANRHAFPHSSIAERIFHMGKPLYRRAQELGVSWKYGAVGDFRLRVKTLSALAPLHLEEVTAGYELIDPTFEGDEKEFLAYFEETYIGRRIHAGGRWPRFGHHIWSAERRMAMGSLRANNATGPSATHSEEQLPRRTARRSTGS